MALCWLQSSGTFFCTKGPERRDDRVRVNLENRIDAEIQTILVSYQRKISNEKVKNVPKSSILMAFLTILFLRLVIGCDMPHYSTEKMSGNP